MSPCLQKARAELRWAMPFRIGAQCGSVYRLDLPRDALWGKMPTDIFQLKSQTCFSRQV
jgi:hypothetical protein